jgi:hypothetical protein
MLDDRYIPRHVLNRLDWVDFWCAAHQKSESALRALKSVTCMVHALRSSKATGLTADASAAPLNVTVV